MSTESERDSGSPTSTPSPQSVKEIVQNFSPAWFAAVMGTGAISILFNSFPYGHGTQTMKALSLLVFFLNLFLFVLFTAISIARYYFYPATWKLMIRHPLTSLYTGCYPMGATTLINVAVNVINQEYDFGGKPFLYYLWIMWWLDVAISAVCCWGMVHFMKTSQKHALQTMTAAWLLPVVTFTVAASTGGILAQALQKYSPLHALISVAAAGFLVTIGLTLAFMMLTIYLLRLIVYGLPPGVTIISVFLPLGAPAQGGYAILLIGQNFQTLLPFHASNSDFLMSTSAGTTIHVVCVCLSFALWAITVMWIIYALLGAWGVLRRTRIPFKLSYWGLIFPNGVFANLTISLSITLDSQFFRVFGAIYAVVTFMLWLFVASRTTMLVYTRSIFEPSSSEDVEPVQRARIGGKELEGQQYQREA